MLLSRGADVEAPVQYLDRPLHLAIVCGHHTMVKLLLDSGAQVNATDQRGKTPVRNAAQQTRHNAEKVLHENGAAIGGIISTNSRSTTSGQFPLRIP